MRYFYPGDLPVPAPTRKRSEREFLHPTTKWASMGAKPSAGKDFNSARADAPTPASRPQMSQTGHKRQDDSLGKPS